MFFKAENIAKQDLGDGVTRRILAHDKNLMLVEFCFEKGSIGAEHSHVHEQVGLVIKGSFEVTINGQTDVLRDGDSYYVPSNHLHGVVSLEENGILIDAFTPGREDFLT